MTTINFYFAIIIQENWNKLYHSSIKVTMNEFYFIGQVEPDEY